MSQLSIGEIVTNDFRAASVFTHAGIDSINTMTQAYTLPESACPTYQLTFKLLKQFEDDLHVHVHLENNILYPKALALTE